MARVTDPLSSVEIRSEAPGDVPGIGAVHRAAFRREDETRLVDRLRRLPGFDPGLSLVAALDGTILGHVLFTPISIVPKDASTPAMALAPLAVLPACQRKGIGGRLVWAGLDACRERKHRWIVVLGHPRYYPRFGFVMAGSLGIECPFPVPPETFMVLDLSPQLGNPARGRVQYPTPFLGLPEDT